MRDDFSEEVKRTVADRVNRRCSHCNAQTSGPQEDATKALNIGVAGHITAASPRGPRYDPNLTPAQRRSANNAIWLCQNCGKLVDNDTTTFTEDEIRSWKSKAEAAAFRSIGVPSNTDSDESEEFETGTDPDDVTFAVKNWIAKNKTKFGFRPECFLISIGDGTKLPARHYIYVQQSVGYEVEPNGIVLHMAFVVSIVCALDTDIVSLIRSLLDNAATFLPRPTVPKVLVLVAEDNDSQQRAMDAIMQVDPTQFAFAYVGKIAQGAFVPVKKISAA